MATSTLTTKGQVTIPKEIRDRMSLHPGDVLDFRFDEKGHVVMEPVDEEPLGRLSGLLSHLAPEKPVSIEAMRKARTTYTFDRVLGRHPALTRLR